MDIVDPHLNDQERLTPVSTIYERAGIPASNRTRRRNGMWRLATGLVIGASIWMCLTTLGVPNVFHVHRMSGFFPAAILGALIGLTRLRRLLVVLGSLLVVAVMIIAYTPIVAPVRALVRADTLPTSADAVVVLSAGVSADGLLDQQGLDRLMKGLDLVRHGIAPTLVVTTEQRAVAGRIVTGSRDQYGIAALAGVSSVISTPPVATTHEEALAVAAIAKTKGWNRIVLVTSPFHTRRACATFERAGLRVSCIPSDSRDVAVRSLAGPEDRIGAFGMWIYEMAGTLQYQHKGWL